MPTSCNNVPDEVLNPKGTWSDKEAYDAKAMELANSFRKNFSQFEEFANEEIIAGGPIA
jgi:phosphoenolpyruvate carboxykinase (ATP)